MSDLDKNSNQNLLSCSYEKTLSCSFNIHCLFLSFKPLTGSYLLTSRSLTGLLVKDNSGHSSGLLILDM